MIHWKAILATLVAGSLAAAPLLRHTPKDGDRGGSKQRERVGHQGPAGSAAFAGPGEPEEGPGGPGGGPEGGPREGGPRDGGPREGGPRDGGPGGSDDKSGGGNGGTPRPRPPGGGGTAPPRVQPPGTDGQYNITVGGTVRGVGSASVAGNAVTITADVIDENSTKGSFSAPSLAIDGNYFRGAGTVLGVQMNLVGRLESPEAADGKSSTVRPPRLVCNFTTADGRRGRVVGFVSK